MSMVSAEQTSGRPDSSAGSARHAWVKWAVAVVVMPLALAAISLLQPVVSSWLSAEAEVQPPEVADGIPTLESGFDFVDIESVMAAAWSNGTKTITPGNNRGDSSGHAAYMSYSGVLENGEPAAEYLEMHPEWTADGVMRGRYGPFLIPAGLVLRGETGYFSEEPLASDGVTFSIAFQPLDGGQGVHLWSATEQYDGRLTPIDVSLAPVAGRQGYVVVEANAGRTSDQDWFVIRSLRATRQL